MRTPYAGGEGGSLAKTPADVKREVKRRETTKKKPKPIRRAVLINAIS